jgi:hippurate hydrolase
VAANGFGGHSEEDLPCTPSEDFSYFLLERPGAFWLLGTKRKEDETLHSNTYDFNDQCLSTGGLFWVRLVEDRLNCKITV